MTRSLAKLANLAFHPFLFAAYAVIALLATNAGQLRPVVGFRSLILALAGTGAIYLVLRLVLQNSHRAGMATTVIVLLLASYGHG